MCLFMFFFIVILLQKGNETCVLKVNAFNNLSSGVYCFESNVFNSDCTPLTDFTIWRSLLNLYLKLAFTEFNI